MERRTEMYQKVIETYQAMFECLREHTYSDELMSDAMTDCLSIIIESILDSNCDLFGETNHTVQIDEKEDFVWLIFQSIGKVNHCAFSFSKTSKNLVDEIVEILLSLYSYRISYELKRDLKKDEIVWFIETMRKYFVVNDELFSEYLK